jgi:hypothetical protein
MNKNVLDIPEQSQQISNDIPTLIIKGRTLGKSEEIDFSKLLFPAFRILPVINESENIVVEAIKRMRAAHVPCADLILRAENLMQTIKRIKQ